MGTPPGSGFVRTQLAEDVRSFGVVRTSIFQRSYLFCSQRRRRWRRPANFQHESQTKDHRLHRD